MEKKTFITLIVLVVIALVFFSYPSELERCIEAREPEVIIYYDEEEMWNALDLSDAFMKCVEDKTDIGVPRISIPAKELNKARSECLSESKEDHGKMSTWVYEVARTKATKACNDQGIY